MSRRTTIEESPNPGLPPDRSMATELTPQIQIQTMQFQEEGETEWRRKKGSRPKESIHQRTRRDRGWGIGNKNRSDRQNEQRSQLKREKGKRKQRETRADLRKEAMKGTETGAAVRQQRSLRSPIQLIDWLFYLFIFIIIIIYRFFYILNDLKGR